MKSLKFWGKKTNDNIEILSAEDLLEQHSNILDRIHHLSRAPSKHYQNYYLYSIEKMAELVQSLPASQAHHHSQKGGFLLHNLEVIENALINRNTQLLPLGSTVEVQNHKKDLWSFAIFTASIMHDIGKVISDIEVFMFDKRHNEIGRWSPFSGTMLNVQTINKKQKIKFYKHFYNPNRQYQQHPLCANILLTQIINPVALDWLRQDGDLWMMLLSSISGKNLEGGIITDIVKEADSLSTANSLKTSNNQNNATEVIPKSLSEKLLDGLKHLTLESGLKINEVGASIYTTETEVFYVSKKIMDTLRDKLRSEKQDGIPNDNTRIMDELLDFNIIIPNNGKAIWRTTITGGGFREKVSLTMLRVPIHKIYGLSQTPKPFAGTIAIDGVKDSEAPQSQTTQNQIPQQEVNPVIAKNDNKNITPKAVVQGVKQKTKQQTNSLPLPPGMAELLNSTNEANDKPAPKEQPIKQQSKQQVDEVKNTDNTKATSQYGKELETTLGDKFLEWLKQSINNKNIEINNAQAKIHIVEYANNKAIFLVSPRVFKEYDKDKWELVQKHFTRTRFNEKSYNDDNIWKIQTTTNRKNKKPSIIKGYLISNLAELGFNLDSMPNYNNRVELISPVKKSSK